MQRREEMKRHFEQKETKGTKAFFASLASVKILCVSAPLRLGVKK
jgi:hypothetical protein